MNVTTKDVEGEVPRKVKDKWTKMEKRKLLQALEKYVHSIPFCTFIAPISDHTDSKALQVPAIVSFV